MPTHTPTIQSSNHVLRYLLKGVEIFVRTKPCRQMFIAALLIITKSWKQPESPSVGEWINNCGPATEWNST